MIQKIECLIGKTVLDAQMVDGVPMIWFEDGVIVEAWRDPEGNGEGHLEIYDED